MSASKVSMGGMASERNLEGRKLLEFNDEKELCVCQTRGYKRKRK